MLLGMPAAHVLGHVEMMWSVVYDRGLPYLGDETDVELACQWQGEPGKLFAALMACGGSTTGLIEETTPGSSLYQVHDLDDHAPAYVAERGRKEEQRTTPKTCDFCGKTFYNSDPRSKYCTEGCRKATHRRDSAPVSDETDTDGSRRIATDVSVTVRHMDADETDMDGSRRIATDRDGKSEHSQPSPAQPLKAVLQPSRQAVLSRSVPDACLPAWLPELHWVVQAMHALGLTEAQIEALRAAHGMIACREALFALRARMDSGSVRNPGGLLVRQIRSLAREGGEVLKAQLSGLREHEHFLHDPRFEHLPDGLRLDLELQIAWVGYVRAEREVVKSESPGYGGSQRIDAQATALRTKLAASEKLAGLLLSRHPDGASAEAKSMHRSRDVPDRLRASVAARTALIHFGIESDEATARKGA